MQLQAVNFPGAPDLTKPTLSPKRQRFVDEYVANGFNATQAYLAAGYSPGGADGNASRLIGNDSIQQAISSKLALHASLADENLQTVLSRFVAIADDAREKAADRIAATREIGKLLGLYIERSVHLSAFVRPELQGKSIEELEAIEAALWPATD